MTVYDAILLTMILFYTANVYRCLQGLYGEMGVRKFQITATVIASIPAIPVIFEVNTLCGLLAYTYS